MHFTSGRPICHLSTFSRDSTTAIRLHSWTPFATGLLSAETRMISSSEVHQPRMKVFTVGLDDKEKAQKVDLEKSDSGKTQTEISPTMPMPPPIIVPRAPPARRFGCGVLSWVVAAFFVVLLCLTISEITYNRQRDQAFLRLKWAELRQRMLGFELLSQAQQHEAAVAQAQIQPQLPPPINELPAFPRRNDLVDDATTTTTTAAPPEVKPEESPIQAIRDAISPKLDLLRMLLSKMRENAEEMGLNGDMQVHVIEVKPIPNKLPQQSIDDAFGETNMPRQPFGPWRNEEEYNEFGNRVDLPWQFDRESLRPSPWTRPQERFNRFDGPQWGQEPRVPQDNHIFGPIWDAPEEEPQMRITHHFDKDSQTPQRVVTELFGNSAPEVIGHMLGQKNAQAQLQFQQQQVQQQQQQQQQLQQQQEMMMQQQQQQQPQPWPQPWAQPPVQPWPQPWAPQPQMWDQQRWDQQQQRWDQPPMPQQAPPPPMVYFFNQMPQQQQPQFQQQAPPPPPPPFQAGLAHQNQFPFPVQNQAPILPQPFLADNNNNNVNAFNNENPGIEKPWYMSGDEQRWQQTWENTNKVDTPFNPHPAASTNPWVENTAVVEPQPVVPQPTPEAAIGRDSDGIDGFPREEKFNVPLDISSDVAPQTVETAPEPVPVVETPMVNAWQHPQPEAAEEPMPASAAMVADRSMGPTEDKDFLPLRTNEEVIGQPLNDVEKAAAVVAQDDFPKKHETPFLQIDDPSSFRQ